MRSSLSGSFAARAILEGRDIAEELAALARERQVTQIVVGQPRPGAWPEALRRSVVNRLLRLPTGADVHVVPHRPQYQ